MSVDLIVAGNLLVDDIVTHEGRTRMGEPGGGALYVSLAASLWGVKVGLVSVRGNDYPEAAIEALRAHAVDLAGVRAMDGPSLRTWLLYEPRGRQIVRQIGTAAHATVSPNVADVPAAFAAARLAHICPMPFELQEHLVEAFVQGGVAVSLDPHETVREENLPDWHALLQHIEYFFVSHEELLIGGTSADADAAFARLERRARQCCLLKCGASGGRLFEASGTRVTPWEARCSQVVDPTGAGDAFAGGVLAGRLRGEPWARALEWGVVSASFAIESWGPAALIAATPAAAERRRLDWYATARGGPA